MREFEVEGVTYRADPMGAIREFNVCRRLLVAVRTIDTSAMQKGDQMALMLSAAAYIGEAPQADVDYILNTSLPFIKRLSEGRWTAIAAPGGALMDETLPMMALVMILWNALEGPVTDFLRRAMPAQTSSQPEPGPTTAS